MLQAQGAYLVLHLIHMIWWLLRETTREWLELDTGITLKVTIVRGGVTVKDFYTFTCVTAITEYMSLWMKQVVTFSKQ